VLTERDGPEGRVPGVVEAFVVGSGVVTLLQASTDGPSIPSNYFDPAFQAVAGRGGELLGIARGPDIGCPLGELTVVAAGGQLRSWWADPPL
jgi:hypothetical protein